MKCWRRSLVLLILLGAGSAGQWTLQWHVRAAAVLPAAELGHPLSDVPLQLGPWLGRDQPLEKPELQYGDAHLQRTYHHPATGQSALVWMAYSRHAVDRRHHPEICMAVAGRPEDRRARRTLAVAGHEAPVQQYRFGRPGDWQRIYYWYYTLPGPAVSQLSALQRLYHQLRVRSASLTVEVFATEGTGNDVELVEQLVREVDAAIQTQVGPHAIRGSHRVPVMRIETS